jgi:hypothetical protein
MDNLIDNGKAKINGDRNILKDFTATIDNKIKNNMNLALPLQKENKIK